MKLKKIIPAIIIFFVITINLAFGLPRLTNFSAVDEHLWTYDRTPAFWKAVADHKWKKTDINDKPGITVALVSGLGLFGKNDPMAYSSLRQGEDIKTVEQLAVMKKINFDFRLPIYLFTLLMAPVFYFLLKKLLNETVALFSIILIYLSPVLLGMSLFINPDSLLWLFVPLSLLSFLLFQKKMKKRYAVLSGLFFGFALLTKYVSSILYPFFIFMIFTDYFFGITEQKTNSTEYFKKSLFGYIIVFLTSTLTVAILYPAVWVNFSSLLSTTVLNQPFRPFFPFLAGFMALFIIDTYLFKNKIIFSTLSPLIKYREVFLRLIIGAFIAVVTFIFLNTYLGMPFLDFQSAVTLAKFKEDMSPLLKGFFGGILPGTYLLIFTLTPSVFIFFIYSLSINFVKKNSFSQVGRLTAFYLMLFIIIYYFAFALNNVYPIVRYQISVYPIAAIMAAIGLYHFIQIERIKKYAPLVSIYILLIIISATSFVLIRPYYFAYASNLLPKKYVLNLNDMGDGSYEAAEFLNKLPNAQNLTIWVDKVAVCEYFVGKCDVSLLKKNISKANFDYYVVSYAREARTFNLMEKRYIKEVDVFKLKKIYASDDPTDYNIIIDNRPDNFVKVVKNPDAKI